MGLGDYKTTDHGTTDDKTTGHGPRTSDYGCWTLLLEQFFRGGRIHDQSTKDFQAWVGQEGAEGLSPGPPATGVTDQYCPRRYNRTPGRRHVRVRS